MKKIFCLSAIVLCGFLTSCKDSTTSADTATSTNHNSQNGTNLANNRKVYKAIETGDTGMMDSLIANDAVDHQGPNGRDINGGDSIRHMLGDMHNHVKDLKVDVVADAANGDYVFSMVNLSGTTDASMGMDAGTKMDEKGVDVVRIKDGKIVEHWGFVDPVAMMKRMQDIPKGVTGKMDKKMNGKMDSSKMKK